MPSLHPDFIYDIFISYRQNDNRSGWVTEFVRALQEELAATIKDPVTVYFDANPHDGLLETHNVDKSLEGKLRCLIFIPILSQTYCDPKSFAWQHEFCAFNKIGTEDQLGRDIKLTNGNVASRILPIRIHDLDTADQSLLEKELGGALRAIDFIYKEAGVNRPLKPEDKKEENLNKVAYRNQVNKVANAIKELLTGLLYSTESHAKRSQPTHISGTTKRKAAWTAAALLLIGTLGFGFYYFAGGSQSLFPAEESSIAVLPFVNMSNDPEQEYFSDGMTDEVLNRLVQVSGLRVTSRTSSMKFKGAKLTASEIADQLGVGHILEGSVQKSGNTLKITIQLIDAQTDTHLWSETYEREFRDVFTVQSDVARAVAQKLRGKLSPAADENLNEIPTQSQLAYEYYLRGLHQYNRYFQGATLQSSHNAIQMFTKALEEDSLFAQARYLRLNTNLWIYFLGRAEDAKKATELISLADKDIEFLRTNLSKSLEYKRAIALRTYWVDRKFEDALEIYNELLRESPGDVGALNYIANIQRRRGNWKESISHMEQAVKTDPLNDGLRAQLLFSYYTVREYKKGLELVDFAMTVTPDATSTSLPFFKVAFMVPMGSDLTAALKESKVDNDTWTEAQGIDFLNPGNLKILQKRKKEGKLERVDQREYKPIAMDYSMSYYLIGNKRIAKAYADSAIALLEVKLRDMPNDFRFYSSLGRCYALAGNEEFAVQNGKNAIELMPLKEDAFWGTTPELELAETYIMLGKYDLALDKIEMLLSIPSELSVGWMMASPLYEPLRELPRFKQIANKYRYQGTQVSNPN